jgi:hypothetical protein
VPVCFFAVDLALFLDTVAVEPAAVPDPAPPVCPASGDTAISAASTPASQRLSDESRAEPEIEKVTAILSSL